MRARFTQVCAAVLSFAVCAAAALAGPAAVGRKAPNVVLESLSGQPLSFDAFAGSALYVNVFATWCPPCRFEMPLIARTLPRYGNVTFLAVDAQESSELVSQFLKRLRVRSRVAIDRGQFAATYGAKSIPESIFIDRHGILRAIVHGPVDKQTLEKNLALIAR